MTALLLMLAATADTTVSLAADAAAVRLSGVVRVTLAVEGPAPLRVDVPANLLDAESAGAWKLTPTSGPTETVVDNRGRWSREYIADPFVPGEAVRLGFAPVAVWAGGSAEPRQLTPEPVAVRVTTGVADPSPAAARPVTGVEGLPDPPREPLSRWATPVLAGGLVLSLLSVALLARLNRRMKRQPTPGEWADLRLAALSSFDGPAAEFAHRLSEAVRQFFHTPTRPALRLTTAELLAAVPDPSGLRPLLEGLDRVRFGGEPLTPADRAAILDAARSLFRTGR